MSFLTILSRRASAAAWTPADLYDGDGDWYLATDLTTLFQDSLKTTQAESDGDVIGAVVGQMGYGPDLLQETGSKKPLLRIENGKKRVEFPLGVGAFLGGYFAVSIPYTSPLFVWAVTKKLAAGGSNHDYGLFAASQHLIGLQPGTDNYGIATFRGSGDFFTTTCDLTEYRLTAASMTAGGTCRRWQGPTIEIDSTPGATTQSVIRISLGAASVTEQTQRMIAFGFRLAVPTQDEMNLLSAWAVRKGAQF
jgi:hypothetical protein